MIDLGKAQVDAELLQSLTSEGVDSGDATELARLEAFGGTNVAAWLRGLNAAAVLMNQGSLLLDYGTLPSPWDSLCPALSCTNGTGQGEALATALAEYAGAVQTALIGAIGTLAAAKAAAAAQIKNVKMTTGLNSSQAATAREVAQLLMQPIDPNLVKQIQKALEGKKGHTEKAYKKAGEILLDWLANNGSFIRTTLGEHYYLHRPTHRLFSLDSSLWHAWLYRASDVNPAATAFRYFLADCKTCATEFGRIIDVVRVAHWDEQAQMLRVSRFDGIVYRLDGCTIEEESNGDGPVLFDDAFYWLPYKPDYSAGGRVFNWSLRSVPQWEGTPDELAMLYRCWWIATFFSEICPTKPILVLKGEKGSGKTMALRTVLRMIFGPAVDVSGVPDRADAFMALTGNAHVAVLDNMDETVKEIRDKIASLSTGKIDVLRRLYTTNDRQMVHYRCWLAVTSRSPDTLQRDDLVDRLLILPLKRIDDSDRTREAYFLREVITKRDRWWGDCLTVLSSVVAEIRRNGIPDRGGLRMEDWAALGTVVARAEGQVDLWESGLKDTKNRQTTFLLEDDVLVQGIESWLSSQQYTNAALTTRQLYEEIKFALFGTNRPESTWPRSVRAYGRRLKGIERELREHLLKINVQMFSRELHGNRVYEFFK
ncbi:MAG: P-loop NTPase family protein [Chloroflexota bacterium]